MTPPALLPLFPLEVVLFPGMPLPLHIFEPRYQQMIDECTVDSTPFGVLLETRGELASIGCSAEIVQVLQRYPDGRLDILTEGRRRFEIVDTDAQMPYLRGSVRWLPEEDEDLSAERTKVLDLYRSTYWAHGQGVLLSQLADAPRMSFLVARSQLLDLPDRQKLLEIPTERERLLAIAEALADLEPIVRRLSGNGHSSKRS